MMEPQRQWRGAERRRERGSFPWAAGLFALLVLGGAAYKVLPGGAFMHKSGASAASATGVYGAAPESMLQKEGDAGPVVLASEGTAPRAVLDKEGNAIPASLAVEASTPAVLGKSGDGQAVLAKQDGATMPDDVRAWLEHLRGIEEKKEQLTLRQMASLSVFMQSLMTLGADIGKGDGDSNSTSADKVTQGKFEDLRPDWRNLISEYHSVQPPQECRPIADSYFGALNEIPGMTGDLIDMLTNAQANPSAALQKVMGMRSKSGATIDKGFKSADGQIGEICQMYGVSKWFSIKDDVMTSGVLALPGMGGNPLGN